MQTEQRVRIVLVVHSCIVLGTCNGFCLKPLCDRQHRYRIEFTLRVVPPSDVTSRCCAPADLSWGLAVDLQRNKKKVFSTNTSYHFAE